MERRSSSYERLAFLGDSVLGLAITTHLWPRLQADTHGAGRLTKIRAQAVSGPSCREVAERLEVPERLRAHAPDGVGQSAATLVETERFRIRPITIHDVVKDYDAVMTSVDHLRAS